MKDIIRKWYSVIFPDGKYNEEFEKLLNSFELTEETAENYKSGNPQKDFLMFLFFCEKLEKKYETKGIPKEIFIDTLSDIAVWTDVYFGLYGKLGLSEPEWLRCYHFAFRLFKLGRLQFCISDESIEVHIPAVGAFPPEECDDSFAKAKNFLAEYFPESKDKPYTCDSWLLDKTLKSFLKPDSNILRFASRFRETESKESYAALRYVFRWSTTAESLKDEIPTSSFAEKLKDYVMSGGKLYETLGVIK